MRSALGALMLVAVAVNGAHAQRLRVGQQARAFVKVDTAVVALTNARVIDGTGTAAKTGQTVVVRDGMIASIGPSASTAIPAGAVVIDLAGKSIIPGLVMVHEHLFYPTGPGVYANLSESFSRLYLAGGVTSMRTGGNMNGYGEINTAKAIMRGDKAGPWIDATAPYLEGPGLGLVQVRTIKDADDARKHVNYWADEGATSFKAYMNITREMLGAAIQAAHARGLKVTGHLCSVTYHEAAALGIDNLEHGFIASNDFVPNKEPDKCTARGGGAQTSIAALDPKGPQAQALFKDLIDHKVTVTSTNTIFELNVPGRPLPEGLDLLVPSLKEQYVQRWNNTAKQTQSVYTKLFPNNMAMEYEFVKAGGMLVVGTDPTGGGGLVPGFSNQRAIELLVEGGFTPLEAIKIATLNGATYLGRADKVGTIAVGKQADLVIINGDPSARIADIRKVEMVFRQGVGFDPVAIVQSVKGVVGLY